MRTLILGTSGQLGRALLRNVPDGAHAVACGRAECDLSEPSSIERSLERIQPEVLINAAAYTAVDQAETDREQAQAINADAVQNIARACGQRGVRLIHISTDFVFDGSQARPYRCSDTVNPLSVYGATKLEGERCIAAERNLHWLTIRTAWVYSTAGRNFVLTMLRLFMERSEVRVVADQVGTPTSATSLAQCVWAAAQDRGPCGILHFTDAGVASWYDFAMAIYEEARALGLITREVAIVPIATEQYPTPARRPSYSVLDTRETRERLNLQAVHWRTNLRTALKELVG